MVFVPGVEGVVINGGAIDGSALSVNLTLESVACLTLERVLLSEY